MFVFRWTYLKLCINVKVMWQGSQLIKSLLLLQMFKKILNPSQYYSCTMYGFMIFEIILTALE